MPGPDFIDGAVTDAVVADTVVSGNERRRSAFTPAGDDGHCSNCGTALKGPICHSCGQDADTFHRPVWSLVLEVLDGFFSFDGRFWRTIPALMFRPGRITRHYLTGVRARYVQPFRLFIVASLAFGLTGATLLALFVSPAVFAILADLGLVHRQAQTAESGHAPTPSMSGDAA